jgi:hypothetical protein
MLKFTDYAKALVIASLISTTLAIAPVRADDGGLEDPPLVQASSIPTDSEKSYATFNCEQQRKDAWFLRELARTDGGETPQLPQAQCRSETYAETNVNAD